MPGWGWYNRDTNPRGTLLPQEITEFTNAGMIVGLATVNLADDPFDVLQRLLGRVLDVRLLQLPQVRADAPLQPAGPGLPAQGRQGALGRGPLRARRRPRTRAPTSASTRPGVTQLFPEGQVIDLHPWEYNEVPVVLGAALATDVPIVALHLTRPPIEIPDREALGMDSHFEAARGAYVLRRDRPGTALGGHGLRAGHLSDRQHGQDPAGARRARHQRPRSWPRSARSCSACRTAAYRTRSAPRPIAGTAMAITNRALKLMRDWVDGPLARGVLALVRLGQPLAHRRHGRRGDGRGAPGAGHILDAIERYAGGSRRAPPPAARAPNPWRTPSSAAASARARFASRAPAHEHQASRAAPATCRAAPIRRPTGPARRTCASCCSSASSWWSYRGLRGDSVPVSTWCCRPTRR